MADTGKIASAIIAKLAADASLSALMPDGVWEKVAPAGRTKFVIVSMASSHDEPMFQGRAFEELVYLVKAVEKTNSMVNAKAAAARIDALLDWQPLTVAGYGNVLTNRAERVEDSEEDEVNADINWQHVGGLFEVFGA